MAELIDVVCDVSNVSRLVPGGLFMGMFGAVCKERTIWRRRYKYVYKFFADDGERRRELKWLTCLTFYVMCLT